MATILSANWRPSLAMWYPHALTSMTTLDTALSACWQPQLLLAPSWRSLNEIFGACR
ncbi:hypothetical protein BZL30_5240 [Mycobacterium kansasii]|uniref:Uncharacterized protein n=1 Tax=Mycobacterium kansasii TaxID=1768 RepID=A0A1V3X4S4_MYCKA|nr:hypothetical protein BZL30_5240 [Mycobacterium kansasii]